MQRLKLKKILPLLIFLITSVVIIIVITYMVLYVRPIWQQYRKVESENTISYYNNELDVCIQIFNYSAHYSEYGQNHTYLALWDDHKLEGNTTGELMDRISLYSGHFSEDQFKWYEYMLENIVKWRK